MSGKAVDAAVLELLPIAAINVKMRRQAAAANAGRAKEYRDAPARWVRECILWGRGEGPTDYQLEILDALVEHKREAVRGPHGLGKTTIAAWVVLWFATTRDGDDWKVVTTASAWRQLTHYLWPEVRKWARKLDWTKLGREPVDRRTELLQLSLKLRSGEAFAVASDDPSLIEGAHADHLLYIFDESKSIQAGTFDAAEGAFSGAGEDTAVEALALAISTPGEPAGRFYEIHSRAPGLEDWHVRHVTVEEAIKAGRISRVWVEQRRRQWGETSAVFQNRVLGDFATSAEDAVIPLSWVEAANERWLTFVEAKLPWPDLTAVGVDVARSGEDKTVLALRYDRFVDKLRAYAKEDTMATAGRVKGILEANETGKAVVDVIGIGAGVVDRLRESQALRKRVVAFNASERTEHKDMSNELGFINKRSAAWWNLREMLDPANEEDVMLPVDDLLLGDLVAPRWDVKSGGKIQVEAKADIKERIGRSTDSGDAVVQAFALEIGKPTPGITGFYKRLNERNEAAAKAAAEDEDDDDDA